MKRYLIVFHSSNQPTAVDYIGDFLNRHDYAVTKLIHPLEHTNRTETSLITATQSKNFKRPTLPLLTYLVDTWLTFKTIRSNNFTTILAVTNIDCLAVIISIKFLRRRASIVYYPRDFSNDRYSNKLLNYIYRHVESFVVKNADITISNTVRAQAEREALGLNHQRSVVAPNGVTLPVQTFKPKQINKGKFVYTGDVSVEHGLYELIEHLADSIESLDILGDGLDLNRIKRLCKQLQLKATFYGFINKTDVFNFLQNFNGFGLAPYNRIASWTTYCSPLKVVEYVACGVPVIVSDVPEIAETIERDKLGVIYNSQTQINLHKKILAYDTTNYYIKAQDFYALYDNDKLLTRALLTNG